MLKAILVAIAMHVTSYVTYAQTPTPKKAVTVVKLTKEQVEKKLYRSWLEIEIIDSGKSSKDRTELFGREFSTAGTWSWVSRGDPSQSGTAAVRIDVSADPMRLDFIAGSGYGVIVIRKKGENREIRPGIFKFEGDNLVIVSKRWVFEKDLEAGEDYPDRPTEFQSTKENKYMLAIMKPATFAEQE